MSRKLSTKKISHSCMLCQCNLATDLLSICIILLLFKHNLLGFGLLVIAKPTSFNKLDLRNFLWWPTLSILGIHLLVFVTRIMHIRVSIQWLSISDSKFEAKYKNNIRSVVFHS